jgi:KUP system potassium uptake protein
MQDDRPNAPTPPALPVLMLGALGVVYGDVGTSPLYTLKEVFGGVHPVAPEPENILGVLSLIFWSLILVISIKYVLFVMRADNHGEGGVMALMELAQRRRHSQGQRGLIVGLGLFGAALFYGDGAITPAISVLSAVEGLEVAAPKLEEYVTPIAVAVLCLLFLLQKHGTGVVGWFFGPIMLAWFSILALLGLRSIQQSPMVLEALNPAHGWRFLAAHGWPGFLSLGAVVLALTGAEALYADMGHFGKRPIRAAWFALVGPALVLNYFGQGALLLRDVSAAKNPFYLLVPSDLTFHMVGLATAATVIASQAVISGVFSITSQAMKLDYIPRMEMVHTSSDAAGQVYSPTMNRVLLLAVVLIVLGFRSSDNLAAAYGVAVTGTMLTTTLLALVTALDEWRWPPAAVGALAALFLPVDIAFFAANLPKLAQGGWLPAILGLSIYLAMHTWRRGRQVLFHHLHRAAVSLRELLEMLARNEPYRPEGVAVFLTARHLSVPPALQRNFEHNHIVHSLVVLLTVYAEGVPRLPEGQGLEVEDLGQGVYRVTARHGFMETPSVMDILRRCEALGLKIDLKWASFFIGRETLIPSPKPDLNPWQEWLFLFMFRNASSLIQYFQIPPEQVVELGAQIEV